MRSPPLRRGWLALACSLLPGLVSAAVLSWAPGAPSLVRGELVYIDLRISGLIDNSVWSYSVNVSYDPSVLRLTSYAWGDGAGGNQLVCPGPTPATCTHIGSNIDVFGDWWTNPGSVQFHENANGLNWTGENLDALQLDDFALLHLGFVGVDAGITALAAEGYYTSSAWFQTYHALPVAAAPVEVQLAEPASWLLVLAALGGLCAGRISTGRSSAPSAGYLQAHPTGSCRAARSGQRMSLEGRTRMSGTSS